MADHRLCISSHEPRQQSGSGAGYRTRRTLNNTALHSSSRRQKQTSPQKSVFSSALLSSRSSPRQVFSAPGELNFRRSGWERWTLPQSAPTYFPSKKKNNKNSNNFLLAVLLNDQVIIFIFFLFVQRKMMVTQANRTRLRREAAVLTLDQRAHWCLHDSTGTH